VLFCAFYLVLGCLFPIFVQVERPLPQSGNAIAVNKFQIVATIKTNVFGFVGTDHLRRKIILNDETLE